MRQVQLQLTDILFDEAKRRAVDGGFKSVEEFVTDVVTDELMQESDDHNRLFSLERIAHIDSLGECNISLPKTKPNYSD